MIGAKKSSRLVTNFRLLPAPFMPSTRCSESLPDEKPGFYDYPSVSLGLIRAVSGQNGLK
jgi:hypothetical protein